MKKDFISINVIIDRSSSMAPLAEETIQSFNQFVSEQKIVPGDAVFTLCTFNGGHELVHDFVKLASVPDLNAETYRPSGWTALLDAMGSTIDSVGSKLAAMKEEDRPSKVLFLIVTDGEENSSQKYSKAQIKAMVEHQTNKYNWSFIFLGANIDAIAEAESIGIFARNSMNYAATDIGTRDLYSTISESVSNYRTNDVYDGSFFVNAPIITPSTDGSTIVSPAVTIAVTAPAIKVASPSKSTAVPVRSTTIKKI